MDLTLLDSRAALGTDRVTSRRGGSAWSELTTARHFSTVQPRVVRVIIGRLGESVRLSAPALGIVVDAADSHKAWEEFLASVTGLPGREWLSFDLGPTRAEEICEGLDAPEDEVWKDSVGGE